MKVRRRMIVPKHLDQDAVKGADGRHCRLNSVALKSDARPGRRRACAGPLRSSCTHPPRSCPSFGKECAPALVVLERFVVVHRSGRGLWPKTAQLLRARLSVLVPFGESHPSWTRSIGPWPCWCRCAHATRPDGYLVAPRCGRFPADRAASEAAGSI